LAKININHLRHIDWDKGNLWEIKFPELENIFGFVPVNDVEINFGTVEVSDFEGMPYEYISGRTKPNLTISFLDNVNIDFLSFIKDWVDEIAPKDLNYVYAINDAKKLIIINKIDNSGKLLKSFSFYVVPNSDLIYHGESDGNIPQYTLSLSIISTK